MRPLALRVHAAKPPPASPVIVRATARSTARSRLPKRGPTGLPRDDARRAGPSRVGARWSPEHIRNLRPPAAQAIAERMLVALIEGSAGAMSRQAAPYGCAPRSAGCAHDPLLAPRRLRRLAPPLDDESVALCVSIRPTSPSEKHRAKGHHHAAPGERRELERKWFAIFKNERFPRAPAGSPRARRTRTSTSSATRRRRSTSWKPMGIAAGFTWWKAASWDKKKIGMGYTAVPGLSTRASRGRRRLADLGIPGRARARGGCPTGRHAPAPEMACPDTSTPRDTSRPSPKAERPRAPTRVGVQRPGSPGRHPPLSAGTAQQRALRTRNCVPADRT